MSCYLYRQCSYSLKLKRGWDMTWIFTDTMIVWDKGDKGLYEITYHCRCEWYSVGSFGQNYFAESQRRSSKMVGFHLAFILWKLNKTEHIGQSRQILLFEVQYKASLAVNNTWAHSPAAFRSRHKSQHQPATSAMYTRIHPKTDNKYVGDVGMKIDADFFPTFSSISAVIGDIRIFQHLPCACPINQYKLGPFIYLPSCTFIFYRDIKSIILDLWRVVDLTSWTEIHALDRHLEMHVRDGHEEIKKQISTHGTYEGSNTLTWPGVMLVGVMRLQCIWSALVAKLLVKFTPCCPECNLIWPVQIWQPIS